MAADSVHHINSPEELNALLEKTTYVVVDFYADWCPPCKAIAPVFESLAAKHGKPGLLAFAKVNVDKVGSVAQAYNISAMPTFLFFKEAKKVAVNGDEMIMGADPKKLSDAAEKLGGLAEQVADKATSS